MLVRYFLSCCHNIPTNLAIGLLVVFCMGMVFLLAFLGPKRGLRWSMGLLLLEYLFVLFFLAVLSRTAQPERGGRGGRN